MKQKLLLQPSIHKAIITSFLLLLILPAFSFRLKDASDELWKMLGLSKHAVDEALKTSFMNGYLCYYSIKSTETLSMSDRVARAKALLKYTRQYITSEDFATQYYLAREIARPQQPVLKSLRTIDEIQYDEIKKMQHLIRETQKNRSDMPQLAKTLAPLLAVLKDNLLKYQEKSNPYFIAIAKGEKYRQENQLNVYWERCAQWELQYPSTVDQFIRMQLQRILDATNDIDHNPELIWNNKNPVNSTGYKDKRVPVNKGLCAARQITELARDFIQNWLNELKK